MPTPLPDLHALRILVAVAELGSLGAAARALGLAQPNASRSMSRLERELGLVLLQRSTSGSALTPDGTLVVDWARDLLAAADHLRLAAEALRGERQSHLAVAASMTVAEYLVPRWLSEFRRTQAGVAVSLEVHNSNEVFQRVRSGRDDVGFVESPSVPAGLHSTAVGRDELLVVVAPSHPWARRRLPLRAEELAATPLIVREAGSGTRQTLDTLLERRRLRRAAAALELTSNAAVRITAVTGAAPAVLSTLAVRDAVRSGELRAVPVELELARVLRAVWRPPRRLVGPAAELVALARRLSTP